MKVKLGDFNATDEQKKIINEIIESGKITEGKYVSLFERLIEKTLGVKHAIATTNGTVSLQLIGHYLRSIRGKNLVVCVPATTFPATANAFEMLGFKTVLCEVGDNLCMDISTLSHEEKNLIDIIVPVSLLGHTPDMNTIMDESKKYRWVVIEDFAEAFGSSYNGKMLGSIGDFGSSSFYMSHVIQAGELGVVTTNDDKAASIMRSMKNHGRVGSSLHFNHDYIGSNYKTTEFCAALGYTHLKNFDTIKKQRSANANRIRTGIKNDKLVTFPFSEEYSYLGFPILATSQTYRDFICDYLNKHGIETRTMFPCLANQKAFEKIYDNRYVKSDMFEKYGFYVGVHQYLTEYQIDYIIRGLNCEL